MSYRIPENLANKFRNIVVQGDRISPEAAGALVIYLILPEHIQKLAKQAAYSDNLDFGIQELRQQIKVELVNGSENITPSMQAHIEAACRELLDKLLAEKQNPVKSPKAKASKSG